MLLVHQQFGSFSQEHMVFKRDYMKKFQGAVKTFLFHKYRNELNWQSVYVVIEYKLLKSKQKSCWLPRTACLCINSSNGCLSHSPSECNLHLGNVRPQVSQAHFLQSSNNGEMIRLSETKAHLKNFKDILFLSGLQHLMTWLDEGRCTAYRARLHSWARVNAPLCV